MLPRMAERTEWCRLPLCQRGGLVCYVCIHTQDKSPIILPPSPPTCAQNKATVTYYLLCDNRRRLPSSGYLRSELSEGVPPQQLPPPGSATPGESTQRVCRLSEGVPPQQLPPPGSATPGESTQRVFRGAQISAGLCRGRPSCKVLPKAIWTTWPSPFTSFPPLSDPLPAGGSVVTRQRH